jgi:hypothetical protein
VALARDDAGAWLRVEPADGGAEPGWAAATELACNAPVELLPVEAPAAAASPTVTATVAGTAAPTLVRTLAPTVVLATATRTPTLPAGSPTPTVTPTGGPAPSVNFSVDDENIDEGECATISWSVSNVQAVYFEGEGVTGQGSRQVCPTTSTTYALRIVKLDGGEETHTVRVNVREAEEPAPTETDQPEATDIPAPTTEAPPENTPEPTTAAH